MCSGPLAPGQGDNSGVRTYQDGHRIIVLRLSLKYAVKQAGRPMSEMGRYRGMCLDGRSFQEGQA